MATDRTDLAAEATPRWSWPAVARPAGCAQRGLVGFGYRRAVAGATQQIPSVPNLPSSLPALGARGQAGAHSARAGGRAAGSGETRSGGGFYRRLLHGGEKRGLAVGREGHENRRSRR